MTEAFCVVIIILACTGLYLQSGIPEGRPRRHMFVFYTNQSNALIALYHLLLLIGCFHKDGALYAALANPTLRYCATLMIWVTHLIYHFVLVPTFKRNREKYEDNRNGFGNLCVHYLVPLLTLLEWFLCADKNVEVWSIFAWLLIPMAYLVYCLLRARICGPIGSGTARYPYLFMDLDKLGVGKWARNMAVTVLFYLALASLLYLAARLMGNFQL